MVGKVCAEVQFPGWTDPELFRVSLLVANFFSSEGEDGARVSDFSCGK